MKINVQFKGLCCCVHVCVCVCVCVLVEVNSSYCADNTIWKIGYKDLKRGSLKKEKDKGTYSE